MKVSEIKKDERNLNRGTETGKRIIDHSVDEYGFGRSIVINADNEVIGGNHILQKAIDKNAKIKIVETDGTELVVVKRKDIAAGSREHYGLAIADNRTSQVNLDFDIEEMSLVASELDIDLEPMEIFLSDTSINTPNNVSDPDPSEAMETNFGNQYNDEGVNDSSKEFKSNDFPLAVVLTKHEKLTWDAFKKTHKFRFDTDAFMAIFKHAQSTYNL